MKMKKFIQTRCYSAATDGSNTTGIVGNGTDTLPIFHDAILTDACILIAKGSTKIISFAILIATIKSCTMHAAKTQSMK